MRHVGLNQLTVKLEAGGHVFEGHPDGIVTPDDGDMLVEKDHYMQHLTLQPTDMLVEIKSMSSYGFREFEKGQIDETHRAQQNIYMDRLGLNKSVMVAMAKDRGVLKEIIIPKDELLVSAIKQTMEKVARSTPDNLTPRKHAPGKRSILPWNCLYCEYWKTCWPRAEIVKKGSRQVLRAM